MPTRILPCTCKNKFQDEQYGPGKRVHNKTELDTVNIKWRCTVCGMERVGKG